MSTSGKKLSALMLSVTLRSLSITRVGPHESSPIDLGNSNLLWWETLQNIQADSRTTRQRHCCLVTHRTRGYWNLKILTRALLALCDKKVITEWQEESTTRLKMDRNSRYKSMLLIYKHEFGDTARHWYFSSFAAFRSLSLTKIKFTKMNKIIKTYVLYLCWPLIFQNHNFAGIMIKIL